MHEIGRLLCLDGAIVGVVCGLLLMLFLMWLREGAEVRGYSVWTMYSFFGCVLKFGRTALC